MFQAQRNQRQRAAYQHEAQAAQRGGEFAVVEVIKHDQRHYQRHNQANAHQVVAHGFGDAVTRPTEVGDEQSIRPGEGSANHHYPQQRHGGGHAVANGDR